MKKHARRIKEHLLGPTGSVILHVVLVFLLFKLVLFQAPEQEPEVEVMILEAETVDLDQLREQLKELEDVQVVQTVEVPSVSMEEPEMEDIEDFQAEDPEVDFAALDMLDEVQGPLVMSGLYAARSDEGRESALRKYAGGVSRYTEPSVLKALEWLKAHQEADGSWDMVEARIGGDAKKASMTGLGLLTFLAHGETPTSELYGETVEKAIRYLVSAQGVDGEFCRLTKANPSVYAHAIATYAVSEAYGLTQIPALREAMERGADVIVRGQQSGGGWDYGYKRETRRDTSVSGWQVQALKAAYIAKADVPGIEEALRKAVDDLESVQASDGRFGYTAAGSGSIGMTGVGVLCLQLLGEAKGTPVRRGILALDDVEVDWEGNPRDALYAWYYITQAKFHQGGSTWNKWNDEFARLYTRMQNEDGSWTSPDADHEAKYGPVYTTTLAALTLQVYYRLLPTYQAEAVAPGEQEELEEEEDLIQVI